MPAVISKRVLEDIRARSNIVDVIGSYIHLQRSGSSFKCLCPFHKEKTPSFHVNPQRQIFHCFGCGAGGDVFAFLMQHENMDFMSAVRMLAERAGIRFEFEAGARDNGVDKSTLYRLLAEVADVYHRGLLRSPAAAGARDYLKQRRLPDGIVAEFRIGYAPPQWAVVLDWAQKKKYTVRQLEAAGLVIKTDGPGATPRHYDRFRNRLMFPIADEQGRVIGFSGRTLEKEGEGPKYVNSPETPLFRKSRVLYALDKARHAIVEGRRAIVCEGQIDVIRCHEAGFTSAVAAQGTAFTDEHARILRRYADEVVLVFDPDRAGQEAAVKAGRVFMQTELAVRVAALPTGEDPDLFILTHGKQAFTSLLDEARPVVDFQVDLLSSQHDISSEAGLLRITDGILETIRCTPNEVQQTELIQRVAPRLRHTYPGALKSKLQQMARRPAVSPEAEPAPAAPASAPPKEELELAEHIVAAPELGSLVRESLPMRMLSDLRCRQLIEAAIESDETGADLMAVLSKHGDAPGELTRFAAQVQMAPMKTSGQEFSREDAVKDLILYIWRRELKRKIGELEGMLSRESADHREHIRAESAQLRSDIKALADWETAAPIIKLSMSP
jgi:DNA primase